MENNYRQMYLDLWDKQRRMMLQNMFEFCGDAEVALKALNMMVSKMPNVPK